jgi:hypothetical protein
VLVLCFMAAPLEAPNPGVGLRAGLVATHPERTRICPEALGAACAPE